MDAEAITILQGDEIEAQSPEGWDGWLVGFMQFCSQSAATLWLSLPLDETHWKSYEDDVIRIYTK